MPGSTVKYCQMSLSRPSSRTTSRPFPGPGLGIRVLGEITEDKLEIVRESDAILREVEYLQYDHTYDSLP
jgi:GMP synthase (glutamine-hydrolysing)